MNHRARTRVIERYQVHAIPTIWPSYVPAEREGMIFNGARRFQGS